MSTANNKLEKPQNGAVRRLALGSNGGYITTLLASRVQEVDEADEFHRTNLMLMLDEQIKAAKKGSLPSCRFIVEKLEGRSTLQMDLAQAIILVQNASEDDLSRIASALGVYEEDLAKRLTNFQGNVDTLMSEALILIKQAYALDPERVKNGIGLLMEGLENDITPID